MEKPTIPKNAKLVFKSNVTEVWQWEQPLFDGSVATFDRIKRPDTVKIIPVLPNGNLLLLAEDQAGGAHFLGFPGGRIEAGEDPLTAAKRELAEETGYTAQQYSLWLQFNPSGSIVWELYYYIAHGLTKSCEPHPDPGEKITVTEITFAEFISIPNNLAFADFRGGGLFNETLIRAQYDKKLREELQTKIFGSHY